MPANQIALIRSRTLFLVEELRQSLADLEAVINEESKEIESDVDSRRQEREREHQQ